MSEKEKKGIVKIDPVGKPKKVIPRMQPYYESSPDEQHYNSHEQWRERVSKMKTVRAEKTEYMPKSGRLTVGSLKKEQKPLGKETK